ncbi:hypothetical protein E2562_014775 [Oryza meyeriana var. granulata]|uniref:Uncharacterized protein n=1 Tax=Oryza meyeriana var. granulata TaxID=110450 RepID=A0A6G1BKJ5_9ORYZ|nr:hypothetical protein E2562_014775 [Oryza meyeriana var. granulata]
MAGAWERGVRRQSQGLGRQRRNRADRPAACEQVGVAGFTTPSPSWWWMGVTAGGSGDSGGWWS